MVGPANVRDSHTAGFAKSSPVWQSDSTPTRIAASVTVGKERGLSWNPTGEETRWQPPDVPEIAPATISPSATGAQIPSRHWETVGTDYLAFYNVVNLRRNVPRQTRIVELPSPGLLVTSFEPHLRQSTVKNLQSLFGEFKRSIGQPMAAVTKAELIDTLTKTYKKTALSPETRNFASAVSLLQDLLRPHWSQIAPEKIDAVSRSLDMLVSRADLSSSVLESFYRDMVSAVGSGISVDVEEDDVETHDDSE